MRVFTTRAAAVTAQIPVAAGLPILGNAWPMYNNLPRFLVEQYRACGPVFRVRALNKSYVVLAGPDASTFVGSAEGRASLHSRPSWVGMIGEYGATKSIVSDDGDLHARYREIMRRGYSRQSIEGRYPRMLEVIDAWLERHCTPGTVVPALTLLQQLIIDEISVAIADDVLFDDIDHIRTQVHWATNVHLLGRWPSAALRLPKYRKALSKLMTDARRIAATYAERSQDPLRAGSRLFDDLIMANREHPDLLTDHELPFNLYGPFLAGMDTASNTVAALLYLLRAHPESARQVSDEADQLFCAGATIDEQSLLKGTRYLNAFFKEAMRMYPSVPVLMRHALTDFEFDGYLVRAGEPVMIATCVTHLSDEHFPDPERFDPTRFLDPDNKTHLRAGVYSPWGRGHHLCIGKRLAEILVPLTVARIVYRQNYELADPQYELKDRFSYGVELALNLKLRMGSQRHPLTV